MPEVDGYQICEALKKNSNFKDLPVILLAGTYEDFDREKGIQAVGTADAILNKPAKSDEIVSIVKGFLAYPDAEPALPMEEMPISEDEVIQEPAFVQEEYAFDEDSEEADLVVESEILDEEAELTEVELAEAELEEVELEEAEWAEAELEEAEWEGIEEDFEAIEEEFVEENEELFAEAEDMSSVEEPPVVVEEPSISAAIPEAPTEVAAPLVTPEAPQESPEPMQLSDEKLDMIADEIAQRLTEKFVPVLMQQLARYFMQFPAIKGVVEDTSKQLVKELLPEIQDKL
jgi:CheY-like chemotaxis protein